MKKTMLFATVAAMFFTLYAASLPTVYIDTANGKSVKSKEKYVAATMKVIGNGIYGYDGEVLYEGEIEIKGRGNTTWRLPKKPYKIKLAKKTNFFGFGKNKHWVLLANYYDESLMRNKFANDLSARLGLVPMDSTWVDVVLNGKFIGNYQFCEQIRVGSSRIDIFDWDDVIGDGDETKLQHLTDNPQLDISGGYLFELSEEYDEVSKFRTASGMKVMVKTPEYIKTNKTMFDYVKAYWNRLEEAWLAPDKRDSDGNALEEYADIDSMAAYWLVNEIMCNFDAVYKSRYAYKDCGQPMVFGPVWDFDWSSNSSQVSGNYQSITSQGWSITLDERAANMFKYWLADTAFREKAVEKYHCIHDYLVEAVADGGTIDRNREYLLASGLRNEALWRYKRGFLDDVAKFKNFLRGRILWLDSQLASEATLERSASIMYGIDDLPEGAFSGAKSTLHGRVINRGNLAGLVTLKIGKASKKGESKVGGTFTGLDGKSKPLKAFKLNVGDSPVLGISRQIGADRVLSVLVDDDSFAGTLGSFGIEGGIASLADLEDGEYVFDFAEQFPDTIKGYEIDKSRLPTRQSVFIDGAKWTTGGVREGNESALKLSVNLKKKTFSGTFKVYAIKDRHKKTFTAKVGGVFFDGVAYGRAKISNLAEIDIVLRKADNDN